MLRTSHYIALLGLIYFLASLAVFGFTEWKIYSLGKELESKVALIAEKNAKVRMYNELSRLIEETKMERLALEAHVLTEEETSSFLTEIEMLGRSQGVTLNTQSLSVFPSEGIADDLVIEFGLSGSESAVRKMLSLFETLPYHSNVIFMSVRDEGGASVQGNIKLSVSLLRS
jgi:hypothetical protein